MDCPSPIPFNKLGEANAANDLPSESGDVLGLLVFGLPEGFPDPFDSAEPRLFCSAIGDGMYRKDLESVAILLPILGGWGKAAMLIDLRTSLPGEPGSFSELSDEDRRVGTSGVELV